MAKTLVQVFHLLTQPLITIYLTKRIRAKKVFKDLAILGKSTMGYFHGFKLHIKINDRKDPQPHG